MLARTGSTAATAGIIAGLLAGTVGAVAVLVIDRNAHLSHDQRVVLLCIVVPILVGLLVAAWPEVANRSWASAARRAGLE